jgi:ribonucleoside-triphosphate reductase
LSSPVSDRMQAAKSGQWWERNGQRALANNSAVYDEKPDFPFFMSEMKALYESYSGERGIFSREAARNIAGRNGRRDNTAAFGCNPCSEILLRPAEFCNLSEVIVRSADTLDQLLEKVEVATAFGTLQATLTNFRYLRSVWKKNCEEEALLGVSLTGLMDHPVLNGSKGNKKLEEWLTVMRERAVNVNKQWAESLGINPAAAITCVKPSGTVSQLALCASGIHPNYSRYYVRTVRQDNKDPMTDFLRAQGVPYEPCVMKPDTTTVFSFPIEAPKTSIFRNDVGAIGQLEVWKQYQLHWCEHKPSITVYYKEDEFFAVCQWIWDNWDIMSGISLLPYDNGTYRQAPYQELTEQEYKSLSSKMPEIDWASLPAFERGDTTTGSQELACTGGVCEVVGSGLDTPRSDVVR